MVELGWIVFPKIHVHSELMNVTIFGNRVSVDMIKLRCGHTGLGWALNQSLVFLIRGKIRHRKRGGTEKETTWQQRQTIERCHCKPKNTKYCQQPAETGRDKKGFFPGGCGRHTALQMPWFQNSRFQDSRLQENKFLCCKPASLW